MLEFRLDPGPIAATIRALGASAHDIAEPTRAAARSAGRFYRQRILDHLSASTGIRKASLRRRVLYGDSFDSSTGAWRVAVWLGYATVDPVFANVTRSGASYSTQTERFDKAYWASFGRGRRKLVYAKGGKIRNARVRLEAYARRAAEAAMPLAAERYAQVFADKLRAQLARAAGAS